jgi:hypothetical protein
MTQCDKIADWLGSGRTLTVAEALTQLGIYALSQRVGELRRQGVPIQAEMVETPGGARVARYRLAVAYG